MKLKLFGSACKNLKRGRARGVHPSQRQEATFLEVAPTTSLSCLFLPFFSALFRLFSFFPQKSNYIYKVWVSVVSFLSGVRAEFGLSKRISQQHFSR